MYCYNNYQVQVRCLLDLYYEWIFFGLPMDLFRTGTVTLSTSTVFCTALHLYYLYVATVRAGQTGTVLRTVLYVPISIIIRVNV